MDILIGLAVVGFVTGVAMVLTARFVRAALRRLVGGSRDLAEWVGAESAAFCRMMTAVYGTERDRRYSRAAEVHARRQARLASQWVAREVAERHGACCPPQRVTPGEP
ncbi:MAG: hypothetical protein QJR03_16325 [Sphaerobacter sp.]|nr:hypothetical protein [Sphaerobacter sp.]